jgi:Cu(I)/Ag(I) efflux system membrane fusion protein
MKMHAALVCALLFGLVPLLTSCNKSSPPASGTEEAYATTWTCAMHPQIRQPKPGQCPICGMDLIPIHSGGAEQGSSRQVTLSSNAQQLAEVRTAPVERKLVPVSIPLAGKITADESRLAHITARVSGRIDRLYVDYTGVHINKADHLAQLYSQELYVMQAEYLIGRQSSRTTNSPGRERLLLSGLTEEQVRTIERTGQPQLYVDVFSPLRGTVIEKQGVEGMYIATGFSIYTIADLTQVWLMLEAYESDLPWLRYGQPVTFTVDAQPGLTFTGMVTFISPVLNTMTRTVSVRVNVPNPDGKLKPGYLANAIVRACVAADAHAMDAALKGAWVCSMHPEVIARAPGKCGVCGMNLVPVESLGYAAVNEAATPPPLVIPASAPIMTGARSVVYVAVPDKPGTYEGREITLGPRAGDYYVVRNGVDEGERVVVNGAFKIDSTAQILAKPSAMNPARAPAAAPPPLQQALAVSPALQAHLRTFFEAYLAVQRALAHDDRTNAQTHALHFLQNVMAVTAASEAPAVQTTVAADCTRLQLSLAALAKAATIAAARRHFDEVSQALLGMQTTYAVRPTATLYRVHCPMAFDGRGADWLQTGERVMNPYFGARMLHCGDIEETFNP